MDSWQVVNAPGAVLSNVTRTVWRQTCWTAELIHQHGSLLRRTAPCGEHCVMKGWADLNSNVWQLLKRSDRELKQVPQRLENMNATSVDENVWRKSDCFHTCVCTRTDQLIRFRRENPSSNFRSQNCKIWAWIRFNVIKIIRSTNWRYLY